MAAGFTLGDVSGLIRDAETHQSLMHACLVKALFVTECIVSREFDDSSRTHLRSVEVKRQEYLDGCGWPKPSVTCDHRFGAARTFLRATPRAVLETSGMAEVVVALCATTTANYVRARQLANAHLHACANCDCVFGPIRQVLVRHCANSVCHFRAGFASVGCRPRPARPLVIRMVRT